MTQTAPASPDALLLRPRHRLTHARQFQAVYGSKARKVRGPIAVFSMPNGLPHARLGLAVGRRCGGAAVRTAIKRRLREAFRLSRPELDALHLDEAGCLDVVITANRHELLGTPQYQRMLMACCRELQRDWRKRLARRAKPEADDEREPA